MPSVGPLTQHMIAHLATMGLAAPALALLATGPLGSRGWLVRSLWPATLVQMLALWAVHAPAVFEHAAHRPIVHAGLQFGLLLSALWFWLAVLTQTSSGRWRAILALLITGKLFCLLGVLLVFAPRPIYAPHHPGIDPSVMLADQHLAGLLMIVACPMTYVLAGVFLAARWIHSLAPAARPG